MYEEIIDFLAAGTTPGSLVAFRPSESVKQRVEDLIRGEKTSSLSAEEADELNHYMQLEHIMRLYSGQFQKPSFSCAMPADFVSQKLGFSC